MIDISQENPMYCEISPPSNGPKKYAMLTLICCIAYMPPYDVPKLVDSSSNMYFVSTIDANSGTKATSNEPIPEKSIIPPCKAIYINTDNIEWHDVSVTDNTIYPFREQSAAEPAMQWNLRAESTKYGLIDSIYYANKINIAFVEPNIDNKPFGKRTARQDTPTIANAMTAHTIPPA